MTSSDTNVNKLLWEFATPFKNLHSELCGFFFVFLPYLQIYWHFFFLFRQKFTRFSEAGKECDAGVPEVRCFCMSTSQQAALHECTPMTLNLILNPNTHIILYLQIGETKIHSLYTMLQECIKISVTQQSTTIGRQLWFYTKEGEIGTSMLYHGYKEFWWARGCTLWSRDCMIGNALCL